MPSLTDLTRPASGSPFDSGYDKTAQSEYMRKYTKVMKWVYWIVGLILLGCVCYVLYEVLDRQIASVLVFVGGFIALYFYYIKWFFINNITSWPAGQSMCPDYLTPVSVPGLSQPGIVTCVDFIGVSTNGSLRQSTPENVQRALSDSNYNVSIDSRMSNEALKSLLRSRGLTWLSKISDDA